MRSELPNPIRPQPIPKWTAPPPNIYKINYDGAISYAYNKARVMVIQDCNGEVIASLFSNWSKHTSLRKWRQLLHAK